MKNSTATLRTNSMKAHLNPERSSAIAQLQRSEMFIDLNIGDRRELRRSAMSPSRMVTERVRRMLGMTGFYKHFVLTALRSLKPATLVLPLVMTVSLRSKPTKVLYWR